MPRGPQLGLPDLLYYACCLVALPWGIGISRYDEQSAMRGTDPGFRRSSPSWANVIYIYG